MKRIITILSALLLMSALSFGVYATAEESVSIGELLFLKPALIVMVAILVALTLCSIVFTVVSIRSGSRSGSMKLILGMMYVATTIVLVCTLLCYQQYSILNVTPQNAVPSTSTYATTEDTTEVTTEATTVPPTVPEPTFAPEKTQDSDPSNWGVKWEIIEHGSIVENFNRADTITFGKGNEYTALEGITTFRGDNYRSGANYGTADVENESLTEKWNSTIGAHNGWTGSGWTGQPLIVRWDEDTKAIMNLKESKKQKEDLVEVIYATLDGYIYFYDLDDGTYTRDPLWVGMNFKGAGSLDPRGYPLMYVGSGDVYNGKIPRMYIIDLINGSIIHERSGSDGFALRKTWFAFDSAPLVDAETDTLIWPGESGILYTLKLNTNYDPEAGAISVDPEETVKVRYDTDAGRTKGYECSCIAVNGYLYLGDNGGMFYCIDLNTMALVWAFDTKDDVNASPVFEWGEDGNGYIYTATSMEFNQGTSFIYKLNAQTGEMIWSKSYTDIVYDKDVSGGILSSPVLGKKGTDLEGLVIYSIAKAPQAWEGILVALSTQTGEVVWEETLSNYCWSSPTAVYTKDNKSYIVICDSAGKASLRRGSTGEILSTVSLGANIEASPAIFENTIVVGTRGQKVYALTIE